MTVWQVVMLQPQVSTLALCLVVFFFFFSKFFQVFPPSTIKQVLDSPPPKTGGSPRISIDPHSSKQVFQVSVGVFNVVLLQMPRLMHLTLKNGNMRMKKNLRMNM